MLSRKSKVEKNQRVVVCMKKLGYQLHLFPAKRINESRRKSGSFRSRLTSCPSVRYCSGAVREVHAAIRTSTLRNIICVRMDAEVSSVNFRSVSKILIMSNHCAELLQCLLCDVVVHLHVPSVVRRIIKAVPRK